MTTVTIQRPYQTVFVIQTNCENLVCSLRLQYGKYLCEDGEAGGWMISVVKHDASYRVEYAGKTIETGCPLEKIDSILFEHTRFDDRIFAMHGAAVEWQGKATLFLAATTSGKTTLAGYLANRGFGYITDDCILLDRTSLMVTPFCTPLHLRKGGLEVLRRYRAAPDKPTLLDDPVIRRYIHTPENCVTEPLPLGRIFFITRTEQENHVIPMSGNEKMAALMKSPITDYPVTGEYIRFLSSLAQTADCRRLYYCDMDYVAEVIV